MFFSRLFRFIHGYVVIIIEGYFVEKFVNICLNKQINLWNIKRKKSGVMQANVDLKSFKNLRKIAKKTKCKVKIRKKVGLRFVFNKYKKRKTFALSLILIALLLVLNSMFIWNIEIVGETDIPNEEILSQLDSLGVKVGTLRFSIDAKRIENKIRLERQDIAWIGLDIKGTNMQVNIVEKVEKPEIINPDEYCNIISQYDGIITKISVKNGTAIVKENDVITKGQLLVMGMIEGKNVEDRYVHADAEIEAKVWRTTKKKVYLNATEVVRNGELEKKTQIAVKNFKINFYKNDTNFKMYDKITKESNMKLFSNLYIPIKIIEYEYYELQENNLVYTMEEAKNKAVEEAREELKEKLAEDSNVVNETVTFNEYNDSVEAEVTWESIEAIGTKEKI